MKNLHQSATGIITYRDKDGKEHRWPVGCLARETAEHLKAHLKRWKPDAEFVRAEIIPDEETLT